MKCTTISGKEIIIDDIKLNSICDTIWKIYEKTGNKDIETAHLILSCAIYGKIEKNGE